MKLRQRYRRRAARIEMVPLIDIVFLLLVFFIYAMLSMAVHRGMNVDLPSSSESEASAESELSVSVQVEDGAVLLFLNREQVSEEELADRLKQWQGRGRKEASVLLFADRRVSYQELYRVLDLVSAAGISAISLQAEPGR